METSRFDFQERMKTVEELKKNGVNPFPQKFNITQEIAKIVSENSNGIKFNGEISTAGRITGMRGHGKIAFIDLVDNGIKLQCCFRVNELGEKYDIFKKYVNRGDFIGVKGKLFVTKAGELTLMVNDFQILSKALYDIPSSWYGLKDTDIRYRFRNLDLMLNKSVRETFIARSKVISEMRRFLDSNGFIEVETPVLQPIYGGANAKPFKSHMNFLGEDWYLRISPELYLKRLIMGGLNKVYEIGKNFRNESVDTRHNPEFTSIELYQAYADYNDIMNLTEQIITEVAKKVFGKLKFKYGDNEIDLTPPWKRVSMIELLKECGYDVENMTDEKIKALLESEIPGGYNRGLAIAQLFEQFCESKLIQPTFVIDHPKETTPLCKIHRKDPRLIERFELYIAGMELANAYTELNDPIMQDKFFTEETKRRILGDEEAQQYDKNFIESMRYGMPPTGGLGIGIDRLIMILTGNTSIKEVILFPMIKKKDGKSEDKK